MFFYSYNTDEACERSRAAAAAAPTESGHFPCPHCRCPAGFNWDPQPPASPQQTRSEKHRDIIVGHSGPPVITHLFLAFLSSSSRASLWKEQALNSTIDWFKTAFQTVVHSVAMTSAYLIIVSMLSLTSLKIHWWTIFEQKAISLVIPLSLKATLWGRTSGCQLQGFSNRERPASPWLQLTIEVGWMAVTPSPSM